MAESPGCPPAPVTVGLVSYDSHEDALVALESVLQGTVLPSAIVVVENHPSPKAWARWQQVAQTWSLAEASEAALEDGTRSMLCGSERSVSLVVVRAARNSGYCGGNNLARRLRPSQFFLALNPDCVLARGGLATLLKAVREPGVSAVSGALLRESSGPTAEIDTIGGAVSRLTGRPMLVTRDPAAVKQRWSVLRTYAGACVLFRSSALDRAGGFPEQFFLYYDELYVTTMLKRQGGTVRAIAAEVGTHRRHATTRGSSPQQSALEAYHGARSAMIFARFAGPTFLVPWLLARLLKAVANLGRPNRAKATVAGVWSGLRA